jgi:hypothetical protein
MVSRDLHIYHSKDLISSYTLWACSFAYTITFSCRIFRFSRLGVVSLPYEWSWYLVPVRGLKVRYFPMDLVVKLVSTGLHEPRSSELSIFQMIPPAPKQHWATTEAAESLIAKLHSQGISSLRRNTKREKFDTNSKF